MHAHTHMHVHHMGKMATSSDLFRQLGVGAKFDLKRFRSDAEKFQMVKEDRTKPPQNDKAPDIFGNGKRSGAQVKEGQAKKKRTETDDQGKKTIQKSHKDQRSTDPPTSQTREEKVRGIRKRHKIYVQGEDIPDPIESFAELQREYGLRDQIIENIAGVGYHDPTPIQMQAIPAILHRRELLACAPTGSGKTAAFLLPIIHQLKGHQRKGFRAVIVSPTRELSQQTYRELLRLSEGSGLRIYSIEQGAKLTSKHDKMLQKYDILVTTPNRLVYSLQLEGSPIKLNNVEWLVVDESDKLFEEGRAGFRDQLAAIYRACDSAHVRRAMFSATFAYDVEQWCRLNLDNVLVVSVGARNTANDRIAQELTFVGSEYGKLLAVREIFSKGFSPPVLVFVQSKERAKELFQELIYDGYNVDVIHADKTQTQRDNIVKGFRAGKIWVLIATELMGRGIDFKGVNLVVNYDFPTSAVSYIHRIGRTGRAGRAGRAVTLFTEDDTIHLRSIANVMRNAGCPVPDYMLQIRKLSKRKKRSLEKHAVKRDTIRTLPQDELRKAKRRTEMMKRKRGKKRKASGEEAARSTEKKDSTSVTGEKKKEKEEKRKKNSASMIGEKEKEKRKKGQESGSRGRGKNGSASKAIRKSSLEKQRDRRKLLKKKKVVAE